VETRPGTRHWIHPFDADTGGGHGAAEDVAALRRVPVSGTATWRGRPIESKNQWRQRKDTGNWLEDREAGLSGMISVSEVGLSRRVAAAETAAHRKLPVRVAGRMEASQSTMKDNVKNRGLSMSEND